jgi:hypothetical protein
MKQLLRRRKLPLRVDPPKNWDFLACLNIFKSNLTSTNPFMLLEAIPMQITRWANQKNVSNGPAILSPAEFLSFSFSIPGKISDLSFWRFMISKI